MSLVHDDARQAYFDTIQNNADRILIHTTEPTTYSEATSGQIGEIPVGSGDYSVSATTGGKKVEPQELGLVASGTGTEAFAAQVDDTNSKLLVVQPIATPAGYQEGLGFNVSNALVEVEDPA